MNDKNNNKEYIKSLFDDDGIKAPERLSEDNILKMLEAEDTKQETEMPAKSEWKRARRKIPAKRIMGVAAALVVAVLGISGIYSAMTAPPDTSVAGGELYTFKSDDEIKNLVKSMDRAGYTNTYDDRVYETSPGLELLEESGTADSTGSADTAAPKSVSNSATDSASSSHSETYLQVDDVDEADIVKTDGKYIYYVNDDEEVVILSAKDGETEKVATVGAGSIDNYVHDIYIKGDILVTVGRFYTGDDEGSTGIVVYDISDRSAPVMISNFRQSGEIITSRMVGDDLYLVTEDLIYQGGRYMPKCGADDKYASLSPSDICCLPEPKSCSFIVLSAIDISSGEQSRYKAKAIFGATEDIYCNDHNLYSFSTEWDDDRGDQYTRISRASLDGLDIKFNGTAKVRGYIVNRFAMDEADGYLRIATTSSRDSMDVNNLYVLDPSLKEAGKVTGFARNESIKAVRYIGTKAYVITYEAIDPLFIIDLADPTDPHIEGEVMIDGFSTLIVPAGNGKLIGIGHATGDNGYGGEYDSGLKLVLFDISDPSDPKVLDSMEFENMTSPAQDDSHALVINSEAGYYAIPYGIENYDDVGLIIEDDMAEVPEDGETSEDQESFSEGDTMQPENSYEAGVLVFKAGDSLSDIDQHALGSEYLTRSVYIGDYIYALDRDGSCSSFKYSM